MSKSLIWSLIIIITYNIQTIDHIFIDIITMFRLISPTAFLCFMRNSGVHTEFRTDPFIWTPMVDCSTVNPDRVQMLTYCKYSLLVLSVDGIEPHFIFAQSAGAMEHTSCFSAECPGYDTKQPDSEIPVMLEHWGMRSTPLWHRSQVHFGLEW